MALAFAGCGYHFTGDHVGLPEDIHSLSVGRIENRTREYGLEKSLAFALERQVHLRRHFRMVEDPAGGDAVLTGTIREVRVRPVAFDGNDLAVQFEIIVFLDLTLTRPSDGHVLWQVRRLRQIDEYSASARAVLTSSSQFQQGTLNAVDVQNPELSNIHLAETERRRALDRLLQQAARDAYDQMVENF